MENTSSHNAKAAKESFNNVASKAEGYAKSIATGAESALDIAKDAEKSFSTRYQSVRNAAVDGYDATTEVVKKYPMSTLLAATATGLFAGLLLARRRK